MEEYLLDYLFESLNNNLLKGNDYPTILFLFQKSYEEGFIETVEATCEEAEKKIGFSRPTFLKSLDNLEFSGLISYETFRGQKGGVKVDLQFIKDILSSRTFDSSSTKELQDILERYIPKYKKSLQIKALHAKKTNESEDIKWKEVLHLVPPKHKDSLQLRLRNVKKFYNKIFLNVKELYNLDAKYKDSLQFKRMKYKVSLHFIVDAKSININDLVKVGDEKYRNIRGFFAKLGTIYNKKYISIISVIDTLFFGGKLFDRIEDAEIQRKSSNKNSNYNKKEFFLNEETEKHIPLHLQDHTENVFGEELSFKESLQNWLDHKKDKNEKVYFNQMLANLKWLGSIKNPIESIEASRKNGAKNIFQVQSGKYEPNSNSNEEKNATVGSVKRWS